MPVAQTVSFVQITNLSDLSNGNSDALHTWSSFGFSAFVKTSVLIL